MIISYLCTKVIISIEIVIKIWITIEDCPPTILSLSSVIKYCLGTSLPASSQYSNFILVERHNEGWAATWELVLSGNRHKFPLFRSTSRSKALQAHSFNWIEISITRCHTTKDVDIVVVIAATSLWSWYVKVGQLFPCVIDKIISFSWLEVWDILRLLLTTYNYNGVQALYITDGRLVIIISSLC